MPINYTGFTYNHSVQRLQGMSIPCTGFTYNHRVSGAGGGAAGEGVYLEVSGLRQPGLSYNPNEWPPGPPNGLRKQAAGA